MTVKTFNKFTKVYGTNAERTAIRTSDIEDGHEITFVETDTWNEYVYDGTDWVQKTVNGAAMVSTAGVPKAPIAPTIYENGGTVNSTGTIVVVDSATSAGSQHIQVSGDVEADVYQELVGFEFSAADDVRAVLLGLITAPQATPEAQRLAFTLNGDVVADATILFAQGDNCLFLPVNVLAKIPSPSAAITRVGCIAKSSGLTKTASSVLEIVCIGLKEVA